VPAVPEASAEEGAAAAAGVPPEEEGEGAIAEAPSDASAFQAAPEEVQAEEEGFYE